MRHRCTAALLIALAATLRVVSPAGAEDKAAEKVTLRAALQPGMAWTFEQVQDASSDNTISQGGRSQAFASKGHQRRVGRVEVVAAKDGAATSLRVAFDDGCQTTAEANGQPQRVPPFAYAGQTVTVTAGAAGGPATDDFAGQADPVAAAELHGLLLGDVVFLPKAPVAVGEEWSGDPAALARAMDLKDPKDQAGLTVKLLGVKDLNGRPVAELKVSLVADRRQRGVATRYVAQGTALVDVATGHVLKTETKGSTTSSGDVQNTGPDGRPVAFHVEGKGTVTTTLTSDFVTGGVPKGAPVATAATPAGNIGDAPAGYAVVATTAAGKSLATHKANVPSARAALVATFGDLAAYFDAKPAVTGAYEDVRDHRSGGASFTATLKGQPVRGWVSCRLDDKGTAAVVVVICRADAGRDEWGKLLATAAKPDQQGGGAAAAQPQQQVALQEYRFPDGTGSVGIAPGWKTDAQTCLQTVIIQGPADQKVSIGFTLSVVTPDSQAVQTQRQLEANARRFGTQVPPLQLLVAPYTGPTDALKNLVPQLSRVSQRTGGAAVSLDDVTEQSPTQAFLPSGKAALVTYRATSRGADGKTTRNRALARIEVDPIAQGSWMFAMTECAAPEATFAQDLPTMLAMTNSLRTNDQVIGQKTRENIDASNRRFATMQQAHKEQTEAFDRYLASVQRNSVIQSRSNTDFDEVIRGNRTVLDTTTGQRTSVDLGNVDAIVDRLNEGQPGRYQQIPLRDELYPLPPGR